MTTDTAFPNWRGLRRLDGVACDPVDTGNWVVRLPDGRTISDCPCCTLPINTARAAKLVADGFYPMKDATNG